MPFQSKLSLSRNRSIVSASLKKLTGTKEQDPDSILQPTSQDQAEQSVSAFKASLPEERNAGVVEKIYGQRLAVDEIRLIEVHPGSESDVVHCSTFTVRKADLLAYEALSYVCTYMKYHHPHIERLIETQGEVKIILRQYCLTASRGMSHQIYMPLFCTSASRIALE